MSAFRSAASVSGTVVTGTPISVTKPAGVVSGDVQLVFTVINLNGTTQAISGGAAWTRIGTSQTVNQGDKEQFDCWYQVAGGSEPSSYSVSSTAAARTDRASLSGISSATV